MAADTCVFVEGQKEQLLYSENKHRVKNKDPKSAPGEKKRTGKMSVSVLRRLASARGRRERGGRERGIVSVSERETREEDLLCRSKRLLGGIDHVEEAVLVPLALVHLRNGRRNRDHAVTVYQQEEGLVRIQLQTPPGGQTCNNTLVNTGPLVTSTNTHFSNDQVPPQPGSSPTA